MSDLRIPLAFDATGRIVHPHEGQHCGPFTCPGCSSPVTWRRESDKIERRAHFAHLPDPSGDCSGESVVHRVAKHMAARIVDEHRAGQRVRPVIMTACERCGTQREFPMPSPTEAAQVEFTLPSGRIADVFCGFAIEVFRSHAVDEEKAADLAADGVDWIEVKAEPLTRDPAQWISTRTFDPKRCHLCMQVAADAATRTLDRARQEKEDAEKYAVKKKEEADASYYRSVNAQHNGTHEARTAGQRIIGEARSQADEIKRAATERANAACKDLRAELEREAVALKSYRAVLDGDDRRIRELAIEELDAKHARLLKSYETLRDSAVAFRWDGTKVTKEGLFEGPRHDAVFLYPTDEASP